MRSRRNRTEYRTGTMKLNLQEKLSTKMRYMSRMLTEKTQSTKKRTMLPELRKKSQSMRKRITRPI